MARLIIVVGADGAGKSFLLEQLQRLHREIKPIKKLTTRPPRDIEPNDTSLDLIFNCSYECVQNCDYVFNYYGYNYGIKKADIDNSLVSGLSPMVIVARCNTISEIKENYRDALVLYVQNALSGADLEHELVMHRDSIALEERLRRQQDSFNDYIQNIGNKLFNYVLINDFTDALMKQAQYVLDNERKYGVNANFIFVIMSFKPQYNDVYSAYKNAVKLLDPQGRIKIEIQRVDDNHGGFWITDKIKSNIERAGLVLCDVSEKSPNVFYEYGYAIAKNKDIIITASEGTELPFDVDKYRTVFYPSAMDLQKKVLEELNSYYHTNGC